MGNLQPLHGRLMRVMTAGYGAGRGIARSPGPAVYGIRRYIALYAASRRHKAAKVPRPPLQAASRRPEAHSPENGPIKRLSAAFAAFAAFGRFPLPTDRF